MLKQWLAQIVPESGNIADDLHLVKAYAATRDHGAFRVLLARHGSMVLGVSRRILGNEADSEDAFQTTFLVLARRASSLQLTQGLGQWLYGVACRTALRLKRNRRTQAAISHSLMTHRSTATVDMVPKDDLEELDAEICRLPRPLREVIILCEVQGHTQRAVAAMLKVPHGTISGRILRARKVLAEQMIRRSNSDVAATAAILSRASLVSATLVPQLLIEATLSTITAKLVAPNLFFSTTAAAIIRSMWWQETAPWLLSIGILISTSAGVVLYQSAQAPNTSPTADQAEPLLIKVEKPLIDWDIKNERPAGIIELTKDKLTGEYRVAPSRPQGVIVRIIPGVQLRTGEQRMSLGMIYSTGNHATFLPDRITRLLKAKPIRQVDLSKDDPQALALVGLSGIPLSNQTIFDVIQIDEFDLGIGPSGHGPLEAYVIKDAASGIGYFGTTWARSLSRDGYGLVSYAAGPVLYYGKLSDDAKRKLAPTDLLRRRDK